MKITAITQKSVIIDELGIKDELKKFSEIVIESKIPVSVKLSGKNLLLIYVDTFLGPAVVAFEKDIIPVELLKNYLNQICLKAIPYGNLLTEISRVISPWKGQKMVGILFTQENEARLKYREQLSKIALNIVNLGEKDLYVLATNYLNIDKSAKFSLSSPSENMIESLRQAFVVDRYVSESGILNYQDIPKYRVNVRIDPKDIDFISDRVSSTDLFQLSQRRKISVQSAYNQERLIESKYWLRFDMGVDCFLYACGLRESQGRVST
ncbi:DUF4940 domain-containing protein [Pseudothermotoga sp.]|uniref:DUF4940 domain-containing protein n=1 Tax=Pseudothermotoga sp. TaxID=2033661 RepID=UPI00258B3807|nr:DUF4940 domain-containing protein [Pseudothermotoga sp.]MDK2884576.1 hypothetical protein [Pseudothermotoga sp.]